MALAFDPNDLQRLNRLVFNSRRAVLDESAGAHHTRRRGEGTDFLDFRRYVSGDDFRKVDWNVYGRTRQLFIRLNEDPRQLAVTILVDTSRSMMFGSPISKYQQAQKLAAALAFVALRNGDRVFACAFSGEVHESIGPLSSVRAFRQVLNFLDTAQTGGQTDLIATAMQLRSKRRARGMVIILSDFLNVPDAQRAVPMIVGGPANVLAVQVLDSLDRGHGLRGTLRLRDSETRRMVEVKINASTLAAYQAAFESQRQQFENHCVRLGQHYLLADTGDSYLELVCDVLRAKAVVR